MYVCAYLRVCVCVRARVRVYARAYMCMYTYVSACLRARVRVVRACVRVREGRAKLLMIERDTFSGKNWIWR